MKRDNQRAFVFAFAILAACSASHDNSIRDTSAPMGATSRFDTTAFAGDWVTWARFRPANADVLRFSAKGDVVQLSGQNALDIVGAYRVAAPGVLVPDAPARETLIVMWVDEDFETAAIGTASGSFGAVLDRNGVVPKDREKAARDILAFYGWDVSVLQRTMQ